MVLSKGPKSRPLRCPVCGAVVSIDPLLLVGDAECRACGSLLWFPNIKLQFQTQRTGRSRSHNIRAIGVVTKPLSEHLEGADSFGTVEAIVELGNKCDWHDDPP
jgi:hypothetical protein